MGVGDQRHVPAAYPRGKDKVLIVHKAMWALGPIWTGAKISPPPEFDPRTGWPVASR